MRHRKYVIVALALIGIAVAGCAGRNRAEALIDAQFYYDRGIEHVARQEYTEAITDFRTVVDSYQGSQIVDQAQFMLAETYYKNEEYVLAAFEYNRLYTDFPSSEHSAEALYKLAMCYFNESPKAALDQENTQLAIDRFNRFIDTYPRDERAADAQARIEELREKLALKVYQNAELYRKLKKYEAAIIYYRLVIQNYPRTHWATEARFGLGEVYINQKNYEMAREMFEQLANSNASDELKKNAAKRLSFIEEYTQ